MQSLVRRKGCGMKNEIQAIAKDVSPDKIRSRILPIRGVQVMLDRDLAELYGVPVKRLNEQVSRNIVRFPSGFMFQLSALEFAGLKSQIAASGPDGIFPCRHCDLRRPVPEACRAVQRGLSRQVPHHRRQGRLSHRCVSQGSRKKVFRIHETRLRRNSPHQENRVRSTLIRGASAEVPRLQKIALTRRPCFWYNIGVKGGGT